MTEAEPSRPPLDHAAVAVGPVSSRWTVEVVGETPSTNAAVVRRARDGATEGLVVVADHQSAGRGRLDRTWVTPPRSALTFSLVLRPDAVPVARWPWLPLLAGVAVADGVRRATGLACALKWPNDVLVEHGKLAGILVERVDGPAGAVAVVGIGINVSTTAAELPVATATSLELAGAEAVDRAALLGHVLTALEERYDEWCGSAGDAGQGLRDAYLDVCDTVGRDVWVQLPDGRDVEGHAVGVDHEGRLELDVAGNGRVVLGAGDVVHVRPRA